MVGCHLHRKKHGSLAAEVLSAGARSGRVSRFWSGLCTSFGVSTENRFNAIAVDPVDRLIRVHQTSLDHAHHQSSIGPARFVINALRREIDRLARGFDDPQPSSRIDIYISSPSDYTEDSPPSGLASPPDPNRCPATCPVSDTVTYENVMLPPDPPKTVIAPVLLTNVGTLFDILV